MAQCSSPEVKNKSKSPKKERKEAIGWSTDPMGLGYMLLFHPLRAKYFIFVRRSGRVSVSARARVHTPRRRSVGVGRSDAP